MFMWTTLRLALVLLLLLVTCSSPAGAVTAGDGGAGAGADTFLDTLEEQVKSIAATAVRNDAVACALVGSCECSRGVCSPLIDDFNSYQCVYLSNNTGCRPNPATGRQTCDGSRRQVDRGFVRIPPINSSDVPLEVRNAVCTQRMLDTTFIQIWRNSSSNHYFSGSYFGSIDGSLRAHPGQVIPFNKCESYDPRTRPWYVGSISILKHIVLLLDTGSSMGDQWNVGGQSVTRLATAQNIALNLLTTLDRQDSVTVLTFNASAAPLGQSYLVPDGGLDTEDAQYQALRLSIQATALSSPSNAQSNITRALSAAVSVFNTTTTTSGALKIVTLFTDGKSAANLQETLTVIDELKRRQIFLFVYQLGDTDETLNGVACAAGGYSEALSDTVMHNPLYALKSYFSFLARSHLAVRQAPFWQPVYADYDDLGQVITVAFPAMSANGQLVGVAGIDIQVAGLDPVLRQQVELSLNARSNYSYTNGSAAAKIEPCSAKYRPRDCSSSSNSVPICARTDNVHDITSLVCCEECGGAPIPSVSSSSKKTLVLSVSVVSSVVAGVIGLGIALFFCRTRRLHRFAVPPLPPPPRKPSEFVAADGASLMTPPGNVDTSELRL